MVVVKGNHHRLKRSEPASESILQREFQVHLTMVDLPWNAVRSFPRGFGHRRTADMSYFVHTSYIPPHLTLTKPTANAREPPKIDASIRARIPACTVNRAVGPVKNLNMDCR